MALSKEESTRETTNLACIAQIILGPCTAVLQDVLAKEMLPNKLQKKIEAFLDKRHIRLTWLKKNECREVFSTIKENPYFNIPLLYACLRCMRLIPPHKTNGETLLMIKIGVYLQTLNVFIVYTRNMDSIQIIILTT